MQTCRKPRAVADGPRVFSTTRPRVLRDTGGIDLVKHGVGRRSGPITRDRHGGVIVRETKFRSFSTAFAGLSVLDSACAFL